MWLFLLLVMVPIIEIALFIEVGGWIGLWPTLAIVVATALAGTLLLRAQGFRALADLQNRLDTGRDPTGTLAHGALILVAGVVLLTPGFFTDALGFALLIPPVRSGVLRFVGKRIVIAQARRHQRNVPPGEQTIETDYEEVSDRPPRP